VVLKKKSFFGSVFGFIFDHFKWVALILCFCFLGTGFVLTRMKNIELDYEFNRVIGKYEQLNLKNKELNAIKARGLSVKNLRFYADKFKLKDPQQKQVIVIP
jgi:hypothetical protein